MRVVMASFGALVLASTGLAQAPSVSARQLLAGDRGLAQSMAMQQTPAIAAGGGGFLMAWSDARAVMQGGDLQPESADDIWFQLLGPDGVPTQPTPTRVFAGPERDLQPQVTWNGSAWLVTWLVQSLTPSSTYFGVRAVRIDANGTVLDPQPLSFLPGTLASHSVATDGQNWVVVAQNLYSALRGVTLSTAAVNPIGPEVVLTSTWYEGYSIAWAQGSYLVAGGLGVIEGRRFDAQLAPIDPAPFNIISNANSGTRPVLCSNGVEYLMAWRSSNFPAPGASVAAARVSAAGVQLSPAVTVSIGSVSTVSDVDWDGAQWFVSTSVGTLTRVSAAGQPVGSGAFLIRPSAPLISIATAPASQGGVCAAWSQNVNTQLINGEPRFEVRASMVSSPTDLGVDLFPSRGSPAQGMSSLAAHGAGGALLLRSESAGQTRLQLALLDSQGAQIGTQLTQVASALDIHSLSLAWDGTRYLAAWVQKASNFGATAIRVRRIAADGSLPFASIVIGGNGPGTRENVDVAGGGGQFFVAAIRTSDLAVWRVDGASGAVLSGPTVVASGSVTCLSICALPSGAAVAWSGTTAITNGGIGFALLDSAGSVNFVGSASATASLSVAAASSGSEILVAWDEGIAGVRARRFDLAGAPLDPAPLTVASTPTGRQASVDACWDGLRYVCAYQQIDGASLNSPFESDVRAARISATGVAFDSQGFALESEAISEGQPAIVGVGGGVSWVASSVLRPDAPDASYRVATRVISEICPTLSTYCTAKVNSQFCVPSIAVSGAASATGMGHCVISAAQIINNKNGLLFYGYATATSPLQGGFLCVQSPVRRTPVQNSGGSASGTNCSGAFSFDFNAFITSGADPLLQVAGQTFACQYWSRDPGDPSGSSLTNAVQGQICQ